MTERICQLTDDLYLHRVGMWTPSLRYANGLPAGRGKLEKVIKLGYAGLAGTPSVEEMTEWQKQIRGWQDSEEGARARVAGDDRWHCASTAWRILAWRIEEVRQMTDRGYLDRAYAWQMRCKRGLHNGGL